MAKPHRIAFWALLALMGLQLCWLGTANAALSASALKLVVIWLPLLPALWWIAVRKNIYRGLVAAGIACLLYFCHGVMEVVLGRDVRFAALEIVLSVTFIVLLSAPAMLGRRRRRGSSGSRDG